MNESLRLAIIGTFALKELMYQQYKYDTHVTLAQVMNALEKSCTCETQEVIHYANEMGSIVANYYKNSGPEKGEWTF